MNFLKLNNYDVVSLILNYLKITRVKYDKNDDKRMSMIIYEETNSWNFKRERIIVPVLCLSR